MDKDKKYVFDEIDTEHGLIALLGHFKDKSNYNAVFRKLQDYILTSQNAVNINWYFDVAIIDKWIDAWSLVDWNKYIDIICTYCKPKYKIALDTYLTQKFHRTKKAENQEILTNCIIKLRKSIKTQSNSKNNEGM